MTDMPDTCKTIAHTSHHPTPKHPAGNHLTNMYYADDNGHQQNQNDEDINEYHGDIHNNYHQEQTQEPPNCWKHQSLFSNVHLRNTTKNCCTSSCS